jgi:hypothetical protein
MRVLSLFLYIYVYVERKRDRERVRISKMTNARKILVGNLNRKDYFETLKKGLKEAWT